MADPLQTMLLKTTITVVTAMVIVFVLKPVVTEASAIWSCAGCDQTMFVLITAILFGGAIMVPIYKMVGIFFG